LRVITPEEFREFTGYPGFKERAKSPMGMIVFAMQLDDAPDSTGPIALVDLDRIHHGPFLWMTFGSWRITKGSPGASRRLAIQCSD